MGGGGYLTQRPCERPTPPELRLVSGSSCAAPRAGRGGGVPPAGHAPLPGVPCADGWGGGAATARTPPSARSPPRASRATEPASRCATDTV